MSTVSAASFAKNSNEYLARAAMPNGEFLIKTGSGDVVILNAKKYQSLIETAYLNSVPGLAESIIEGMNTPLNECVSIDWKNGL